MSKKSVTEGALNPFTMSGTSPPEKNLIKETDPKREIEARLVKRYGGFVLPESYAPFSEELLDIGRKIRAKSFLRQPTQGSNGECHLQSLINWLNYDHSVYTGYARYEGFWCQHSWNQDKKGKFIEVTPVPREAYYGFKYSEWDIADRFYENFSEVPWLLERFEQKWEDGKLTGELVSVDFRAMRRSK